MTNEMKTNLLGEIEKLHQRHELAKIVDASYYEPGMMEYLDMKNEDVDWYTLYKHKAPYRVVASSYRKWF